MGALQPDGRTYREHLEAIAERSPEARAELEAPELPEAAERAWRWYGELSGRRPSGGLGGVGPLLWSEIEAWQRVRGVRPDPWELEVILELDTVFLESVAKRRQDAEQSKPKPATGPAAGPRRPPLTRGARRR